MSTENENCWHFVLFSQQLRVEVTDAQLKQNYEYSIVFSLNFFYGKQYAGGQVITCSW